MGDIKMSFSDVFKKSFLKELQATASLDIVIALLAAIIVGAYIFYFYKKVYKGVMFSKMFATALAGMTVITTFIILAVTSNVVLSLGMVGALSIVRFRSSIKEPVDIIYIFWAISEGIVIGSKQYILAFAGTIAVSIVIATFSTYKERLNRYILVVRHNGKDKEIMDEIKANCKKYEVKSNTLFANNEQELITEIIIDKNQEDFIEKLKQYKTITMASLVKYNGEYIIE